jgi:hypothetical protein
MRKVFTLFCLFSLSFLGAQESGEDKWGAWYMYFGMNRVSDKLSVHSEAQFRYYETQGNFNQMLLRTGLNYHISQDAIATLGYAYILTDDTFSEFPDDIDSRENRIFQQFILKNKVGEFLFEHRYRIEQRFFDFGDFTDTQHRARYRLQVTLPLTDIFYLNAYDEVFLNLQDEIFNQNRLYFALGVNITDNSSLQLGYLKNHFRGIDFDRLQVGLFFNPDFRKENNSAN